MAGTSPNHNRAVDRALVALEALVGLMVVGAIVGQSYGGASTVVFLSCGLATGFTGWVLVRMFQSLRDPSLELAGRLEDEERERLEHEKLLLLQGIKELEADMAVGKVDAEDYQHLRSTAEYKALQIITKLKETDAHWMKEAERLVAARLGAAALEAANPTAAVAGAKATGWATEDKAARQARSAFAGLFDNRPVILTLKDAQTCCSGCGAAAQAEDRYCSACGRPIQKEAA